MKHIHWFQGLGPAYLWGSLCLQQSYSGTMGERLVLQKPGEVRKHWFQKTADTYDWYIAQKYIAERGRGQIIIGPHYSSFLVLLSVFSPLTFFWVHYIRTIRMFHLSSPILLVETICSPHLNSSCLILASTVAWFSGQPSASFLPQSCLYSLYWQVRIFTAGAFAIWTAICNPINPGLMFPQHYFRRVTTLLCGSWWLFFACGTQTKFLSLQCQVWVCPGMPAFSHTLS